MKSDVYIHTLSSYAHAQPTTEEVLPDYTILTIVFSSSFSEGDDATTRLSANSQRVIKMMEDVDVVHTILDYLCTNEVTFGTLVGVETHNPGLPICSAEEIYKLAHRLELEDLQRKACLFLKESCTTRNITERVFSEIGMFYEDVKKVYQEYFQAHSKEIQQTTAFKEYFERLEAEGDMEDMVRIFKRFRELV